MGGYKGPEKRGAPRGGEITEKQARDALERVITEAKFTEGNAMRGKIRELILPAATPAVGETPAVEATESGSTPVTPAPESGTGSLKDLNHFPRTALDAQARKYVEGLVTNEEQGYALAHNTLTDGGLYNPEEEGIIKAPTAEEAVAILLQKLSMEEVEAIKRFMKFPGLAMEPEGLPWRRFISNLDTGKRNRFDTSITANRKIEFDRQDSALGIQPNGKITGWQVGVAETEGEQVDQSRLLKGIIQGFLESEAAKLLQFQTHQSYSLSQKRALLSGKPFSTISWAILQRADKPKKGESPIICPDGLVSSGYSNWVVQRGYKVYFDERSPHNHYYNTHLRFALMKKA